MYTQQHRVYDYCFGSHELLQYSGSLSGLSAYSSVEGILATNSGSNNRVDLVIDVIALTGIGELRNSALPSDAVPLADSTEYGTNLPSFTPGNPQALDLDADQNTDVIIDLAGKTVVDPDSGEAITPQPAANSVAVFLGGKQAEYTDINKTKLKATYDLIRLKDTVPDTQDQGLLKSLSQEDLDNTDLFVFRASNDQLILQRKGLTLTPGVNYIVGQSGGLLEGNNAGFYYTSVIPGPKEPGSYYTNAFSVWQAKIGMNPALHTRQADHLRLGERVKIIAINRKTGYMDQRGHSNRNIRFRFKCLKFQRDTETRIVYQQRVSSSIRGA